MAPKVKFSVDISQEEATDFARRLATDDEFRGRFEQDPSKVLREFGISIPPGQIDRDVKLPPKERFAAAMRAAGGDLEPSINPFLAFVAFVAFLSK